MASACRSPVIAGYYNWSVSDQGVERRFSNGEADYSTDIITASGVDFIANYTEDDRPFFLYLASFAPHAPWTPAPRHKGAFAGGRAAFRGFYATMLPLRCQLAGSACMRRPLLAAAALHPAGGHVDPGTSTLLDLYLLPRRPERAPGAVLQ